MKVLFLGVTSFTGFHFVKQLSNNKSLKIYCVLTKKIKKYKCIKKNRLKLISKLKNIKILENIKFGDKNFLNVIRENNFDIICFHYAYTENYNDDSKFNFKKSIRENLNNIEKVFSLFNQHQKIIITNTVFQNILDKNYEPVNNYGKSKSITYEVIKNYCFANKIKYKSFYIPNPWGKLEEKKLNYYLIKQWYNGKTPTVNYPRYIRDNIFIDKLSKSYCKLIFTKSNKIEYFPTGYCSSNKNFIEALRFEFSKYFNKEAKVKYVFNKKHIQPIKRINGDKVLKKVKIKENLNDYFNYYEKQLSN